MSALNRKVVKILESWLKAPQAICQTQKTFIEFRNLKIQMEPRVILSPLTAKKKMVSKLTAKEISMLEKMEWIFLKIVVWMKIQYLLELTKL